MQINEIVRELIDDLERQNTDQIKDKIHLLESYCKTSSVNYEKNVRKIMSFFLNEINRKYGIVLTPELACQLVDANLSLILPDIDISCSNAVRSVQRACCKGYALHCSFLSRMIGLQLDSENIPVEIIIGGIEIFAGALICVIPFPITRGVGFYLISDGCSRVFDGVVEKGKENQPSIKNESEDNFDKESTPVASKIDSYYCHVLRSKRYSYPSKSRPFRINGL